jgi:hypothetical protein
MAGDPIPQDPIPIQVEQRGVLPPLSGQAIDDDPASPGLGCKPTQTTENSILIIVPAVTQAFHTGGRGFKPDQGRADAISTG